MELTIIGIIVGAIVSVVTVILVNRRHVSGVLKIDRHNPTKMQYLFVVDEKDLDRLHTMKTITLKIDPNADLSQN